MRQVGLGYIIVGVFMTIFVVLLLQGSSINNDLASPPWASAIAVILVLPMLLPPAIRYLGPRLTGIKIPNLIEFTFSEINRETGLGRELANTLSMAANPLQPATEFAGIMTSRAWDIVNIVDQVRRERHEVFVVDLKKGDAWVTPNLYFLALLLTKRTFVGQIVFVQTGQKEEEFVAMSSPEELLDGLSNAFPDYKNAASAVHLVGLESTVDARTFFDALKNTWENSPPNFGNNQKVAVTPHVLANLIGMYLHREAIDYKGSRVSDQDYRYILNSANSYVAIISNGQLLMVINRDDLALRIAKEMTNAKFQ